jgi:hypothetical protein
MIKNMHGSKNTSATSVSRRNFLKSSSAAIALAAIPGPVFLFRGKKQRNKMVLSFYMDDTNPERVKAEPYKVFLDYCQTNGIKGESSLILGSNGKSLVRDPDTNQRFYLEQAKESYIKGIDSHMEIMTHWGLFDFKAGKKNEEGIHEGLWLHEPGVTVEEYQAYFSNILNEGEKAGIKFTGLTWPGCSCAACKQRYAELRKSGPLHITRAAFQSLLNLAKAGKFRGRVIPIFYESSETEFGIFQRAAEGKFGVYDLMPNCKDNFGIWENSPEHANADYYITEDGKSGIILKHLENNDPYCMWYMHWQGLNPGNGVGWDVFKKVNSRIRQHLNKQVVWMRPSDIVTAYHDAGGWSFTKEL